MLKMMMFSKLFKMEIKSIDIIYHSSYMWTAANFALQIV